MGRGIAGEEKNGQRKALGSIGVEAEMNRHLLLWLIAIALLATVGCPPRHPPHTPQPFGTEEVTGSSSLSVILLP
jgi:hypothetical protein